MTCTGRRSSRKPGRLRADRGIRKPPRPGQDIINEAQQNLAVTQGVSSFFIHPDDDPLSVLQQVVTGLKALGYTFVSPATLMSTNG